MNYSSINGPAGGVEPVNVDVFLNTTDATANAIAIGDVVLIEPVAGKLTTAKVAVVANGLPSEMFGVALQASESNTAKIQVRVSGIAKVKCHSAADANKALGVSGVDAAHLALMTTTVPAVGGAYAKQIGIGLVNTTDTGDLTSVLFDGISGFSRGSL